MNKLNNFARFSRPNLHATALAISTLFVGACTLSPGTVGADVGEIRGGNPSCGEPKDSPSFYGRIEGNRSLKCALADTSQLRTRYWTEIRNSERTRNLSYVVTTVAASLTLLSAIDEAFGPENIDELTAKVGTGAFLAFGLNSTFNTARTQNRYIRGLRSLTCAEAAVSPYILPDEEYNRFRNIFRGSDYDFDIYENLARSQSALRIYESAIERSGKLATSADRNDIIKGNALLLEARNTANWGATYLQYSENRAPAFLNDRLRTIKNSIATEALEDRVTEADVKALYLAGRESLTEFGQAFAREASETPDSNVAQAQSLLDKNELAQANLKALNDARSEWQNAIRDLQVQTGYLEGKSQAVSADFSELAQSGKCGFESLPAGVQIDVKTIEFVKGEPKEVLFSASLGEGRYQSEPSNESLGVSSSIEVMNGAGSVKYDGSGGPGTLYVRVWEASKPSSKPARILVNIVEPQGSQPPPNNPPKNNGDTKDDSASAQSKFLNGDAQNVSFLQKSLNSVMPEQIEVSGEFDEPTREMLQKFMQARGLSGLVDPQSFKPTPLTLQALLELSVDAALQDPNNDSVRSEERRLSTERQKTILTIVSRHAPKELQFMPTEEWPPNAKTRRAIAWFQYLKNKSGSSLEVNGMLNKATLQKIFGGF